MQITIEITLENAFLCNCCPFFRSAEGVCKKFWVKLNFFIGSKRMYYVRLIQCYDNHGYPDLLEFEADSKVILQQLYPEGETETQYWLKNSKSFKEYLKKVVDLKGDKCLREKNLSTI